MGLAACFSAMEVVPLTLLTLDAWDFVSSRTAAARECGSDFAARQKWAIYFLMAVGFWNFVGAGVFGFLINLPIVSYFEVGTAADRQPRPRGDVRRLRHARPRRSSCSACARCRRTTPGRAPSGSSGSASGGSTPASRSWSLLDLFPGGVLQLWDVLANGYWHARRLTLLTSGTFHTLEWVRIVADTVFLVAGRRADRDRGRQVPGKARRAPRLKSQAGAGELLDLGSRGFGWCRPVVRWAAADAMTHWSG